MILNGLFFGVGLLLSFLLIIIVFFLFGFIGIIFSTVAEWIDNKINSKKE